jgi:hypothetical protein
MPKPQNQTTYVMQCAGFLKIGRTGNIERRFRQIQVACPLDVLLLRATVGDFERQAHLALRDAGVRRVHGEWFKDGESARDVLMAIGLLESE